MSLSKRNPTPREENDFYRTPWGCGMALLQAEEIGPRIWEPACGDGALASVLRAEGYDVVATDLIDRGYGEGGVDFLECEELRAPVVVTNPPFALAEEFADHALTLGATKVVLILRMGFLAGARRYKSLFRSNPPSRVWVHPDRPTMWHGTATGARDTGGAIDYAWYVWDTAPRPPGVPPGCFLGGWLPAMPEPESLSARVWHLDEAASRLGLALAAWAAQERGEGG